MSNDNSKSIFGIPIRTDLNIFQPDNFKPKEIDQIRNYFTDDAEGIELFSIIRSDTWEFRFTGTPYFFKIQGDGTLSNIKFYNDITSEKFSVEELLSSKSVPDSVKKIVSWNIEIFSKTYNRKNFGWMITENVGIGIVNPKGLARLNVKKDK